MIEETYKNIYFIGIGGIGMSALARYFQFRGLNVSGYDKTESELTKMLENEGINIHYEDLESNVINQVGTPDDTLVVFTPAVPQTHRELIFLKKGNYKIKKRAEVLGEITKSWKTLAVAGTHGKTTTSSMLAYVLSTTPQDKSCAILGGISTNFNSNIYLDDNAKWMVVEADEYDRSFLQLHPNASIITSVEADHLNYYKSESALIESFNDFGNLIHPEGKLILHHSVQLKGRSGVTYGIGDDVEATYRGFNMKVIDNRFFMDIVTPDGNFYDIELGLPGVHNAENALSVIALCNSLGISIESLREGLASFLGVKRRFNIIYKDENVVYIDDYAHHPTAIRKLIESVKMLYKNKPIILIFQPHLFSRTKDFLNDFAAVLSTVDEVVLMPIYPAREEPIEGVTSEALASRILTKTSVMDFSDIPAFVKTINKGVLVTVGAGSIDRCVEPIKEALK